MNEEGRTEECPLEVMRELSDVPNSAPEVGGCWLVMRNSGPEEGGRMEECSLEVMKELSDALYLLSNICIELYEERRSDELTGRRPSPGPEVVEGACSGPITENE